MADNTAKFVVIIRRENTASVVLGQLHELGTGRPPFLCVDGVVLNVVWSGVHVLNTLFLRVVAGISPARKSGTFIIDSGRCSFLGIELVRVWFSIVVLSITFSGVVVFGAMFTLGL